MTLILKSLPFLFVINALSAHEAQHLHQHVTDPDWMPFVLSLFAIGLAAFFAWSRK